MAFETLYGQMPIKYVCMYVSISVVHYHYSWRHKSRLYFSTTFNGYALFALSFLGKGVMLEMIPQRYLKVARRFWFS